MAYRHNKRRSNNKNRDGNKPAQTNNQQPNSKNSAKHVGTNQPSQNNNSSNKHANVEVDDLSRYPKKYGIMFFENINELIDNFEKALSKSRTVDKLNIVIHTDEIPKTNKFPKNITVYTGEIWWNIHKNRVDEGWYVGYKV